jgi:phosphoribosylanthranilate isomerase
VWVKICGVTRLEDAEAVVGAGADALGLNLVPASPRSVDPDTARRIVDYVAGRLEVVGVIADLDVAAARDLREQLGLDSLQLHGNEPPEALAALLPAAFKALRVGDADDVAAVDHYPGDRILVDARVEGRLGGTGHRVPTELIVELAARRRLIVAGGLDAEHVAEVVARVRPFGVDVASGVERDSLPREKDPDRVAAFVRAAKRAAR